MDSIQGLQALGKFPANAFSSRWWRAANAPAPLAAYNPMGAADLASSYVNLENPGTYNAYIGIAPTFTKTLGWTFAASAFLKSGLIPAAGWSMIVRFRDSTTNVCVAGSFRSGAFFSINPRQVTNNAIIYGNGGQLTINSVGAAAAILAIAGNKGYRNGAAETGTIGAWTTTSYETYIGATNNNGTATSKFTGSIQAMAIWDVTLTAFQVASIMSRLTIQTYTYRAVFDGDSLTAGTGADVGYDYPSQVNALQGFRWEKSNLGVGGATIANMLVDAVSQVDALYKSDRQNNIVVCWAGHNDLNTGRTAAATYTDITTYVAGRQAAGYDVVVVNIKKANSLTDSEETERVALNVLIAANSAGADGVVDIASAAQLQNPNDATYFTDGTHLTTAGYAVVAQRVYEKIVEIL